MKLNKFIKEAEYEALKSPMKHKYGCVLICDNKIISSGYNYYSLNSYGYSVHAEIDCISKVSNKLLPKCSLILIRIGKDCKCCQKCKKLIEKYNIKRVYYVQYH